MAEVVRHGIEQASGDLKKENQEKIAQEVTKFRVLMVLGIGGDV